ncbi:MAG: cation:proton antiporter [Cyclobacteriaceae bacterium]|nr:cation:proton antiporter [Cyclobacteriaceae bacterium]MCH8516774.1 cation:proton antiporter [Cyclobacteriaceae bacterium]
MDLSNPFYLDALWLSIAFVCGLLAKRIGLPPLVGFLLGGFIINFTNLENANLNSAIQVMADIGVMLLLFTIGLKLKLKSLFRPEIWGTATIHMLTTVVLISGLLLVLGTIGLSMFADLSLESALMISFAMSFSSTVFVVKTLESRGEFTSFHGKIAIGILIIQDIIAVLFIVFSEQKLPSLWVITLPAVIWILKIVLNKLLDMMDHGEMVPIFGFFATFIAGALSFDLVGLKPDLGALVMGMLLVNHPRVDELYDRMLEYKDFFLIAFFINVGLIGLPNIATVVAALILLPLIFVKGILFLGILSRFPVQPRTAYLGSLSLSNYSEFGLIVGVIGLSMGLIEDQWMVMLALSMSFSFALAAPLNNYSHIIYDKYKSFILRINKHHGTEDQTPISINGAEVLVIGLGSIGKPTYDTLKKNVDLKILGLDYNTDNINLLQSQNYNVLWADATDSDFWEKVDLSTVKAVFLSMSDFASKENIMNEINKFTQKSFKVYSIAEYADKKEELIALGVDFAFNAKEYVGEDFVEHSLERHPEIFNISNPSVDMKRKDKSV